MFVMMSSCDELSVAINQLFYRIEICSSPVLYLFSKANL